MADYYVYTHGYPDGTTFYVGKGKGLRYKKFAQRNSKHRQIVAALGVPHVKIDVYPCPSEQFALQAEIKIISALRCRGVPLANLTAGGGGIKAFTRSQESKARMSQIMRLKYKDPAYTARMAAAQRGKKMPASMRANIAAALRGKKLPPEVKAKISAAKKGRLKSAETKARMSEAQLARRRAEREKENTYG